MGLSKKCSCICLVSLLILTIWDIHAVCRPLNQEFILQRHEEWMAQHGRTYKDAKEKERRANIFKNNLEYIETFNNGVDRGYKLAINKFSDLTTEEFHGMYTGYEGQTSKSMSTLEATSFTYENLTDVPTSMDWRKRGAVTPVKSQGQCGCCWAFSAVAALEGINQIKNGDLTSLSEQELLDCDTDKNQGCKGGVMSYAFEYVRSNGGLTTEANYPYQKKQSTCKSKTEEKRAVNVSGYKSVQQNEKALLQAVAKQPVSVGIDARSKDFQFYSSGIFKGDCETNLSHGVTVVGYDTDIDGTKYWIVKNSWGTGWGENGYIRMQRDVAASAGLCGISMEASYPTLE